MVAFYTDNNKPISVATPRPAAVQPATYMLLQMPYSNSRGWHTYGGDIFTSWHVTDNWKLAASYSYLEVDAETAELGGSDPQNQFQVQSYLTLPCNLEFDLTAYYVDSIPTLNIPDYIRTDMRLGWRPTERLELSLVGQNLFDPAHPEQSSSLGANPNGVGANGSMEIERSLYGKLT